MGSGMLRCQSVQSDLRRVASVPEGENQPGGGVRRSAIGYGQSTMLGRVTTVFQRKILGKPNGKSNNQLETVICRRGSAVSAEREQKVGRPICLGRVRAET
eukprot:5245583-Prymnesium_polylepis.1